MPSTGQEATQEAFPTRSFPPEHPDVRATMGSLTFDDVAQLDELVDAAEKHIDDPDAALATLATLTNLRIATRRSLGSGIKDDAADERGQAPPIPHAPGGAMPSQTTTPASTRRPFVGYDREREAYERLKAGLLSHAEGQYVVLVGDELVGPFDEHEAAQRAGYARFGRGPLFIKQVLAEERPIEVTRLVAQ
jgi:hypothetical protein